MDRVIVQGTEYYVTTLNGQRVMVEVCPEGSSGTSTSFVSGKGRRNRYHRSGNIPRERTGWKFETKEEA
jgi:hypothetical protein